MSRRIRDLFIVTSAMAASLSLACGGGVTPPPPDLSGNLIVTLGTPNVNDRAVQLALTCPEQPTSIAGALGYDIYYDLAANPVPIIAVRKGGQSIPSAADIVTMAVHDTTRRCTATVQSVAYQGYGVRVPPFSGYSLAVAP